MGNKAIQRAYPQVRLSAAVSHTPLRSDLWTGLLYLAWKVDRSHPLVIGAGWFSLLGGAGQPDRRPSLGPRRVQPLRREPPEVIAEIVRQGQDGKPALPGSSLKGAVRQAFELLTPSCQLAPKRACRVAAKEYHPRVCPACSLFGAAGLGGRLAFGEALPADENSKARVVRTKTPTAWPPRKWKDGTTRVYDQRQATTPEGNPVTAGESTWVVWGEFRSKLRLINASDEELGLLFAALGIGAGSPSIRLGGKKYHGFGAADVSLLGATRAHPNRADLAAPDLTAWANRLVERWVSQIPERKLAWAELHQALASIG
jgi:hypothetical protein